MRAGIYGGGERGGAIPGAVSVPVAVIGAVTGPQTVETVENAALLDPSESLV